MCLYVRNTIESKTLSVLHKEDYEVPCCILRPKRGYSNIIAGVIYHPPGANNTAMKEHIKSSLEIIDIHVIQIVAKLWLVILTNSILNQLRNFLT